MELYEINNGVYTFRVTGNTRLKILQEFYEEGCGYTFNDVNTPKWVNFKKNIMYITITNKQNFIIPYDKCYLTLKYNFYKETNSDKYLLNNSTIETVYPDISCVYNTPDYIPIYVSQPNMVNMRPITDVLNHFNIISNDKLYSDLIYDPYENENETENIYETLYPQGFSEHKTLYPQGFSEHKTLYPQGFSEHKTLYSNIIFIDGEPTYLTKKKYDNNPKDILSDDDSIIYTSASDEPLYN
jgi:hypothetical protein